MSNIEIKALGFVGFITFVSCVVFGAMALINKTIGHWTDYKIAQMYSTSAVDIARLQAQDHITVACMKYSWFTSMTQCISAGGVNSVGWGLWQWLLVTTVLVIAWKVFSSWLGSDEE